MRLLEFIQDPQGTRILSQSRYNRNPAYFDYFLFFFFMLSSSAEILCLIHWNFRFPSFGKDIDGMLTLRKIENVAAAK